MRWKSHVRCGVGEKLEIISKTYLALYFCYEGRQRVIDYVVEKYGHGNVSQIITFGTMAARACIRE